MAKNEVAVIEDVSMHLPMIGDAQALEVMQENFGGEVALDFSIMQRIKVPGSGGTTWEVPTSAGEWSTKVLTGVVVFHHPMRTYFPREFDGSGEPPDCLSLDAKSGFGSPGGMCAKCPLNQFGTANKGSGKACSEKWRLYILLPPPAGMLPHILDIPVMSVKPYRLFLAGLGQRLYYQMVIGLRLHKAKSESGIDYAQIEFCAGPELSQEEASRAGQLKGDLKSMWDADRARLEGGDEVSSKIVEE